MGRAIRRVIRLWELVFDVREDQGHHKMEGGNLPSWLKFRWDAQCSPIVRASPNNLYFNRQNWVGSTVYRFFL